MVTVILLAVTSIVVVYRGPSNSDLENMGGSNKSHDTHASIDPILTVTTPRQVERIDSKSMSIEEIPTQVMSAPTPIPAPLVYLEEELEDINESFIPSRDGFRFQNFSGGAQSAEIQINDLVEFFGVAGLCVDGAGELCVPYPGVLDFLDILNEVLANGLCYGFSAAATEFFSEADSLISFDENVDKTFQLNRSSELDHHIARWHMLQFTEEFRQVLDQYYEMSPSQIAEDLWRQLDESTGKSSPPMTLALYSSNGAHSVTPLFVEREDNKFLVNVYDSNWPGQTRILEILSDGSWTYQGAHEDPDEVSGTWQENGPGTMALIPHTIDAGKFRCFFCEESPEPLEGTGSVLILNSLESETISVTVLDTHGNKLRRGIGENISEIEGVRSYILPGNVFSGVSIMVYLPPELRQFGVTINTGAETAEEFTLLHAGMENPTTTLKGRTSLNSKDSPAFTMQVDSSEEISTVIDSEIIRLIKQASSRSTTFFELEEGEIYESSFRKKLIDDVRILDRKSGKIKFSLDEMIENVDLPLRPITNEDGIRLNRNMGRAPILRFQDEIKVSSIFSNEVATGFETQYPDGTRGDFRFQKDGQIISYLTDGSSSVRSRDGSIIQSTSEGLLVHKDTQGEFGLFLKEEGRIITINPVRNISDIGDNPTELIRTFDNFLKEREVNSIGADRSSVSVNDKKSSEKSADRDVRSDEVRYEEKKAKELPHSDPEAILPEAFTQRLFIVSKFRENVEESRIKGIDQRTVLDQAWHTSNQFGETTDSRRDESYSR